MNNKCTLKAILSLLLIFIFSMLFSFSSVAKEQKSAVLLPINGAIGPATQDFIHRGLRRAKAQDAAIVILQMDTPGGLDKSMRGIIKDIFASTVPVIAYVAPSGARAASAGTYILYASHVAAMAPGTNLGAATPVQLGMPALPGDKADKSKEQSKDVMGSKMTNDAAAYIRALAQRRGRNVAWAQSAVRKATSLSSKDALNKGVIDIIAKDIPDLLRQVNGRKISIKNQTIILDTTNMPLVKISHDWRTRFLTVITEPSIAYILLLIGIYGLFFEFSNPGLLIPGITGTIAILLALYAFQLLPINYAGLALIVLGVALLAGEAVVPSFGALGIGGIISFVAGSILLLDTGTSAFAINWLLIFIMAIINAAFFFGVIGMAIKSKRRAIVSGREELIGLTGVAQEDFSNDGWIRVHSESWKAITSQPVKKGQEVKVKKVEGLILIVEPKNFS